MSKKSPFAIRPDRRLYEATLSAFGLTAATLARGVRVDPDGARAALDRIQPQLWAAYRPSIRKRCVPPTWDRSGCIRLLRHMLRSRGLRLRSRVARVAGNRGIVRLHYCDGGLDEPPRPVARYYSARPVAPPGASSPSSSSSAPSPDPEVMVMPAGSVPTGESTPADLPPYPSIPPPPPTNHFPSA